MRMSKIKKWGYDVGYRAVGDYVGLPPDINRDNFKNIVQVEFTYLEQNWGNSSWWIEKVLPKLQENRQDGFDKDLAFQSFLEEAYNGFYQGMSELFEAVREGEKINTIRMLH